MIQGFLFAVFMTLGYGVVYVWIGGYSIHFGDPASPLNSNQSFLISIKSWLPHLHYQVNPATALARSLFSTQIAFNSIFFISFLGLIFQKVLYSFSYGATFAEKIVQFFQNSVPWSVKKIYLCSPYQDMYKNQFRFWKIRNLSFVNSPEFADLFLLVVSSGMKKPSPEVSRSISSALQKKTPIICMNQTGLRRQDRENCPEILENQLALHISVEKNPFKYALKHWGPYHKACIASGYNSPHYYPEKVYIEG